MREWRGLVNFIYRWASRMKCMQDLLNVKHRNRVFFRRPKTYVFRCFICPGGPPPRIYLYFTLFFLCFFSMANNIPFLLFYF